MTNIVRPFDSTGRERDRGLFALKWLTVSGALASVALGGWIMGQAANASRIGSTTAPSTPSGSPPSTTAVGSLTPEQLAALQFSPPKQAAPAAPLRPAPAPQRVTAPAPAPVAKTGTS